MCGRTFERENQFHLYCSDHCHRVAADARFSHRIADTPAHILRMFPRITCIWENADTDGSPCKGNWEIAHRSGRSAVLAHAHSTQGVICVPGFARNTLWDDRGNPLSTLLHEYAHVLLPHDGHSDNFWATNKALHQQYGVALNDGRAHPGIIGAMFVSAAWFSVALYMVVTGGMNVIWLPGLVLGPLGFLGGLLKLLDPYEEAQEQVDKLERETIPDKYCLHCGKKLPAGSTTQDFCDRECYIAHAGR